MSDHYYWKSSPDISQMSFDPSLRKATLMMKLLVVGLNPLFEKIEESDRNNIQTFLGSLHGEIEPTLSFLKSYAQKDWARPFLFQNSLHHSTTGFASQQFNLLGPSYSLCAVRDAQKEILRAGLAHLMSNPRPTLLIHVENLPAGLAKISPYKELATCEILYLGAGSVSKLQGQNFSRDSVKAIHNFSELSELLKSSTDQEFLIDQCRIPFTSTQQKTTGPQ